VEGLLLFYIIINRMIDLTIIINQVHHCYQLHSQFYPTFFRQYEIKRIMGVNFYVILQHPMPHSAFFKYVRKNGNTVQQYTSYLDVNEAYDVVRRKVLYNVHPEFVVPMKHMRLIKTCFNEMQSEVWIGKHSYFT